MGANDELIFDGNSMALDNRGRVVAEGPAFAEGLISIDTTVPGSGRGYTQEDKIKSVHDALILGIRDYVEKCGFTKVVIGLSGGIDSAVTCALAAKALGGDNVLGITMPSPYSSSGSVEDSKHLSENLGIKFKIISISDLYNLFIEQMQEHFIDKEMDATEENLQARIRGNILMAFSNKYNYLLLNTGNKSELAVGYCTLYGDMSGGLGVLSDLSKTMVYKLAHYINRNSEIIPEEIIEKKPSAELRLNQTDQDSLPPYEVLDQVLYFHIEKGNSIKEIVDMNFEQEIVKWVIEAVQRSEHKRKQAPPGLKISSKAFGVGRRMPVASRIDASLH